MDDKPKVVELKNKESVNAAETLADYLERAKSGEIASIGVVLVNKDGSIRSDYSVDQFIHLDTLIGALEHLKHRIFSEITK